MLCVVGSPSTCPLPLDGGEGSKATPPLVRERAGARMTHLSRGADDASGAGDRVGLGPTPVADDRPAVDERPLDAARARDVARPAVRHVVDDLLLVAGDGARIEDGDVGGEPRSEAPSVRNGEDLRGGC